MTTLIAVYNSDGCVGRCDKACYEARHKRCTCICGGLNHRAGKITAMGNIEINVGLEPADVKRFAEHRGFKCEDLTVVNRVKEPNAKRARQAAYMALTQYDLFERRDYAAVP